MNAALAATESSKSFPSPLSGSRRRWLKLIGPGLITGASDDDPSGIATYSQVGAAFGMQMLWVMLFTFPLMSAIQQISARLGRVTGHGIAGVLRERAPRWLVIALIGLLLGANTVNIGADLGAMGDALHLLIGGRALLWICAAGVLSLAAEIFVPYHLYVRFLKWSTLSLFAYVIAAFVVHAPWRSAFYHTIVPHLTWSADFFMSLTAVLGTTLSPYLLFWQASEEVDDMKLPPTDAPLKTAPTKGSGELRRISGDTNVGMAFSNLIAWFIVLTSAAVFHRSGHTTIETSQQAAEALAPLAGRFAALLFTLGIVGTGLLAIPVLAGSAAYGLGEAMGWTVGLEQRPRRAAGFYTTIAVATLVGLVLNALQMNPIRALFWAAVLNAIAMVPIMIAVMRLACDPRVMGEWAIAGLLRRMGWTATAVMTFSVGAWGCVSLLKKGG